MAGLSCLPPQENVERYANSTFHALITSPPYPLRCGETRRHAPVVPDRVFNRVTQLIKCRFVADDCLHPVISARCKAMSNVFAHLILPPGDWVINLASNWRKHTSSIGSVHTGGQGKLIALIEWIKAIAIVWQSGNFEAKTATWTDPVSAIQLSAIQL